MMKVRLFTHCKAVGPLTWEAAVQVLPSVSRSRNQASQPRSDTTASLLASGPSTAYSCILRQWPWYKDAGGSELQQWLGKTRPCMCVCLVSSSMLTADCQYGLSRTGWSPIKTKQAVTGHKLCCAPRHALITTLGCSVLLA